MPAAVATPPIRPTDPFRQRVRWSRCRQLSRVLVTLLAWWVGPVAASDQALTAEAVVDRLHQALLEAMRDGESLGFRGRYEAIAPVVAASHDFGAVARLTLQPAWRQLDASQRAAAVAAIQDLSIATYANRFARYGGERFAILDGVESADGRAQVRARLTTASGREVSFEYLLAQEQGVWRIVNILADGVSDLALRRAEYARILREQDFDGLLEQLAAQADALASGVAPERP